MPIPNLFMPSLYVNYALRNTLPFPFKITHPLTKGQKSFRGADLVYVSKKASRLLKKSIFKGKQ